MQNYQEFISENLNSEKKLVIYCKAGVRSRMACQNLAEHGLQNFTIYPMVWTDGCILSETTENG